jgi:signal peptidase II
LTEDRVADQAGPIVEKSREAKPLEMKRPALAGRSWPAISLFLLVTLLVLTADLWLKRWSFNHVAGEPIRLMPMDADEHYEFWRNHPHRPIVVLPSVLNLQLTTNPGAVFGLGKGKRSIFIFVSILATGIIGVLFYRSPARAWTHHVALGLILSGALGNLYDRVRFAAVRDMLHMLPGVDLPFGLNWPNGSSEVWPWIFNLADVALIVGVSLVLIMNWFAPKPSAKTST